MISYSETKHGRNFLQRQRRFSANNKTKQTADSTATMRESILHFMRLLSIWGKLNVFFFQDLIFSKAITLSENLPLKRRCVINDNSQSGSNIQMMVIQYWITNRRELDFKTSWSWPCNIGLKMIYFFDTGTRGRGLGSRQGSYVSDREKTGWLSRKVRHQFPAFVHWNLPPCPKERFPKPEGGGVPAPDGRKDKDAVTC